MAEAGNVLPFLFVALCSVILLIVYSYFLTTSPFIFKTTRPVEALDSTVIDLLICPTLLVLYFTVIEPVCPGINGSLLQEGTVQPQDERDGNLAHQVV